MDLTLENKKKIQSNRRDIFELETTIGSNKAQAYSTRALIDQNYTSIMRNYSAAFMGNHNLICQNTDDIFRNRVAILSNMEVESSVEINFRESMTNEANLDFLEMRASMNKLVVDVNNKMSEINTMLIEINKVIMKANEKSVKFNIENLNINEKYLKGEYHPSKATIEDNKKRAEKNGSRCKVIKNVAKKNSEELTKLHQKAKSNSIEVLINSADISKRKETIINNQKIVHENQSDVAEMISNK